MRVGKNEPGERRAGFRGDRVFESRHNSFLNSPY
jgi:hypothetical protein